MVSIIQKNLKKAIWPNKETWYHEQIIYKDSTTNISEDGIFEAWANGKRLISDNSANLYGAESYVLNAGWTDAWHNPCPTGYYAKIYYDDIYIDSSIARIILGDSSNFTNCSHQEIQIPTTWEDGSITFTANQGSFLDGDNAYLFVVDENGTASEGYPILLGSGSTTCSPADTNTDGVVSITELMEWRR